ncbi:MAG: transketolase, partial [Desulfovibrio sp.]|nr:transketolase [Desulfovibrio sp.]
MTTRRRLADALRVLAMDAVEKARSGHPGAPLGLADAAEALWNGVLRHNPADPAWPDRDRFVLSNGHGSMLLYGLLHLSGYDLSLDDLANFRQLGSKTPGHPEYGVTPGVETTTGPLGQGIANAVGMALAERLLAAEFNREGFPIVNHRTWVFLGDGCMMEGVSHEACALAGTLGLGKLAALWDDNGISIDGRVDGWFTEDVAGRFEAYGWRVIRDVDGHDGRAVAAALELAAAWEDRPTLICCRTVIGRGAPGVCGDHGCHGAPLGPEEIAAARRHLCWDHPPFEIPEAVRRAWDASERGERAGRAWREMFEEYSRVYPELAAEFSRRMAGRLPAEFGTGAEDFVARTRREAKCLATRKASQETLKAYAPIVPELFGGSADLTSSNLTAWPGAATVRPGNLSGNYLSYGVREFAMAAMMNGMALHGGFVPYGGTFLVFSDYARNALRMAALMGLRVIHVLTHDSIGVGQDGPTHQPVEQVASLRLIPNMRVWRPCDAVETAVAWREAIIRPDGPTCLVLSRQNLAHQPRSEEALGLVSRGGYVLVACPGEPEAVILATGSEVALAVEAAGLLADVGRAVRVASMPCLEVFDAQDEAYRESVAPGNGVLMVAVEAGVSSPWHKYVGRDGL